MNVMKHPQQPQVILISVHGFVSTTTRLHQVEGHSQSFLLDDSRCPLAPWRESPVAEASLRWGIGVIRQFTLPDRVKLVGVEIVASDASTWKTLSRRRSSLIHLFGSVTSD